MMQNLWQPIHQTFKNLRTWPKLRRNPNVLIHVGKCGGTSLRKAILSSGKTFYRVHIKKPPVHGFSRYTILIRHPVHRALSAFNWRYRLVIEDGSQRNRFRGEHAVLQKYGSLDHLARSLYTNGISNPEAQRDFRRVHHLKENLSYYLTHLLARITPDQVEAVLTQENLDADIARHFGVTTSLREKNNAPKVDQTRSHLSEEARQNLRRFLAKDFEAIETLHRWGKLDDEAFFKLTE